MAHPIPKRFLEHSVVYRQRTSVDRNRETTYKDFIIQHVRVGLDSHTVKQSLAEAKEDRLLLFIDSENSQFTEKDGTDGYDYLTDENLEPYIDENGVTYGELLARDVDFIFPNELDVIIWKKHCYLVRGVTPCYTQGADKIHHLEVQLE